MHTVIPPLQLSLHGQGTNSNGTDLTLDDVVNTTPRFWKLHIDLLTAMDGGAINLVSVQYNLFVGTVAPFAATQPELAWVIHQAMKFDISCVLCTSSPGHTIDLN